MAFGAFKVLKQAESTDTFSLEEMVGSTGRVPVGIPANHFGTVLISFAGASHNMTATADSEIAAGRTVKVVAVAGSWAKEEGPVPTVTCPRNWSVEASTRDTEFPTPSAT